MTLNDDNDKHVDQSSADPLDELAHVKAEQQHELDRLREASFSSLVRILENDHERARNLRKGISTIAVFVVIFFGVMLAHSWLSFPDYSLYEPAADRLVIQVALVISPVFAITTIMVALLIGVFRVPKRSVVDNLLSHGGRAAAGTVPGND